MVNYIEIKIHVVSSAGKELLIAELTEAGFEGFEEELDLLKGYIPENDFSKEGLEVILQRYHLDYSLSVIEQKNWNEAWETSFEPVPIADFCCIRAEFHKPQHGFVHEIIITPKMSFGTGHHATTYLMIEAMKEIDFNGKRVLDFGTGTGVLAILAEKMGADNVEAVDNDEWSINNATENIKNNHSERIILYNKDVIDTALMYDVILANINRNVILQNLLSVKRHIAHKGIVLLSGLLTNDRNDIVEAATAAGLKFVNMKERNSWIRLKFSAGKD